MGERFGKGMSEAAIIATIFKQMGPMIALEDSAKFEFTIPGHGQRFFLLVNESPLHKWRLQIAINRDGAAFWKSNGPHWQAIQHSNQIEVLLSGVHRRHFLTALTGFLTCFKGSASRDNANQADQIIDRLKQLIG